MSPSLSSSFRESKSASLSPALAFLRRWWLPIAALCCLCLLAALTPAKNLSPVRTPLQSLAQYLGHSINSIWVGFSLILLVVPSLVIRYRTKEADPWIWRALDAVLLDFLSVDALGKNLFTGLGRPGRPDQPGFPSGHSTMAFMMAWLIWQRFPRLGPLWFAMATLISWSRLESHAHYPYQVIAGALYASALSLLMLNRRAGVLMPRLFLSDSSLLKLLMTRVRPATP